MRDKEPSGRSQLFFELLGGAGFLVVTFLKVTEGDVYPAGDYRATLAFKLIVGVLGFGVGLLLLIHALAIEWRRSRSV